MPNLISFSGLSNRKIIQRCMYHHVNTVSPIRTQRFTLLSCDFIERVDFIVLLVWISWVRFHDENYLQSNNWECVPATRLITLFVRPYHFSFPKDFTKDGINGDHINLKFEFQDISWLLFFSRQLSRKFKNISRI